MKIKLIKLIVIILLTNSITQLNAYGSLSELKDESGFHEVINIDPDNENDPLVQDTSSIRCLQAELTRVKKEKSSTKKKFIASAASTIALIIFAIIQHYELCPKAS